MKSAIQIPEAYRAKIHWYRTKLECRNFIPRADDIFIVTYPRSGTTWLQMILYQIFTDGDMDFTSIHEWSPFLEDRISGGQNIEHLPSPRIIKSHLDYESIPKGPCKYIYVIRNGKDVAISYFHFTRMHGGFNKKDFGKFFRRFIKGKHDYGSWFDHVSQWWDNRHNLNVMFLTYEELISNRTAAIRKIIDFCEREVGPEKFDRILERSSFAFMKLHEGKLNIINWKFNWRIEHFIRKGQAGEWKECFSSEQEEIFQRGFARHLNKLSPELKDSIR